MQLSRLRDGLRRASAQAAFASEAPRAFPNHCSCCPVDGSTAFDQTLFDAKKHALK